MPITAFSNATDGLDPSRRNRDHFITNSNVDDDGPWIPYADGVWVQPCCFDVTSGGFSAHLKGLLGAQLGVHYHVGTVRGYTLRGRWAHTLVIAEDSPEPALILFIVEGGLIFLDSPEGGGFAAYEDGFSVLELARSYYRENGIDARLLDALIR